MKKVVGSLLFMGCLMVSYTIKAKRQNREMITQALTAQSNLNDLNVQLKQAKTELKEIQDKIDKTMSKSDKRRLSAIQNKITKLQKEEQDIRSKTAILEKQLESKKADIKNLSSQISKLVRFLEPYIDSGSQMKIVA